MRSDHLSKHVKRHNKEKAKGKTVSSPINISQSSVQTPRPIVPAINLASTSSSSLLKLTIY